MRRNLAQPLLLGARASILAFAVEEGGDGALFFGYTDLRAVRFLLESLSFSIKPKLQHIIRRPKRRFRGLLSVKESRIDSKHGTR